MKAMENKMLKLPALLLGLLAGCTPVPQWTPDELEPEKRTFGVLSRQLPPPLVYNRLSWVRPPDVIPSRVTEATNAPVHFPVVHLDLKDATLEEASLALAGTARYRSYCSSLIAGKRINFDRIGTIDELAAELAMNAQIEIVVDHDLREVRFLNKPGAVEEREVKSDGGVS